MRMNSLKLAAASFILLVGASSWASSQTSPSLSRDQLSLERGSMRIVELERTSSDQYSYLVFDFEAKTVTLVKVNLRSSYTPLEVTVKKMN